MPFVVSLVINVPVTLAMKRQDKYEKLSKELSENFDISLFFMTPLFAFLIAEALDCSGLNTLIFCGLFQGIYTQKNLDTGKKIIA